MVHVVSVDEAAVGCKPNIQCLNGDKVVLEVQSSADDSPSCSFSTSDAEPELGNLDDIEDLAGNIDPRHVVLLRFECLSAPELKVSACMHACPQLASHNLLP